jgi:hypothetical protein
MKVRNRTAHFAEKIEQQNGCFMQYADAAAVVGAQSLQRSVAELYDAKRPSIG